MGVGIDGGVCGSFDGESPMSCCGGYVYGADSEGFREAEFGVSHRGCGHVSGDCIDCRMVGDIAGCFSEAGLCCEVKREHPNDCEGR